MENVAPRGQLQVNVQDRNRRVTSRPFEEGYGVSQLGGFPQPSHDWRWVPDIFRAECRACELELKYGHYLQQKNDPCSQLKDATSKQRKQVTIERRYVWQNEQARKAGKHVLCLAATRRNQVKCSVCGVSGKSWSHRGEYQRRDCPMLQDLRFDRMPRNRSGEAGGPQGRSTQRRSGEPEAAI